QYGQLPQVAPSQGTPTRSPTAKRSARSPRSATVPMISWPGTSGNFGAVSSPSTTWRSVQADAAGVDPNEDLVRARLRHRQLGLTQRRARSLKDHGAHERSILQLLIGLIVRLIGLPHL